MRGAKSALKVAAEACLSLWAVLFHPRAEHRVPLSGHLSQTPDPGLKPWAVLYSRFAAKSDRSPAGHFHGRAHLWPQTSRSIKDSGESEKLRGFASRAAAGSYHSKQKSRSWMRLAPPSLPFMKSPDPNAFNASDQQGKPIGFSRRQLLASTPWLLSASRLAA